MNFKSLPRGHDMEILMFIISCDKTAISTCDCQIAEVIINSPKVALY